MSSALADQAREQEGFLRVLQSSHDALAAVRSELNEIRAFVESRDRAMVALLKERLPDASAKDNVGAPGRRIQSLDEERASLKRSVSVKLDSIAGSVEAVEWRVQESLAALAGRVSELERSSREIEGRMLDALAAVDRRGEEQAARMESALAVLSEAMEARQQEVARAILDALDPVSRVVQIVQGRLARAASELAMAQASLFSRLAEREERLERQRDQILSDLLDEFAGTLKHRDRLRIGAGLREADQSRKSRRDAGRNLDAPGTGARSGASWMDGPRGAGVDGGTGGAPVEGPAGGLPNAMTDGEAGSFVGIPARLRRGRKPSL